MELPPLPRTLILDYYDSYTNNLLTLFTRLYSDAEVLNKVVVVKADHYDWEEFRRDVLPGIDCVILSPGPGSPDKPEDIGFALDLIRSHPVPILGVCLGHQAIGVAFGGKIVNMPYITHGHVVSVAPVNPAIGLFSSPIWTQSGGGVFDVVVYNSLTVEPESLPAELEVTAWSAPTGGRTRTIQGLRHRSYPIWGVQYHPESISSTRGAALVHAFLDQVHKHHSTPPSFPPLSHALKTSCSFRVASNGGSSKPSSIRRSASAIAAFPTPPISPAASHSSQEDLTTAVASSSLLRTKETRFGDLGKALATQDVFERVIRSRKGKEKALGEIWLDGQTPTRPTTTSFAVPSFLLSYSLASRTITLHASNSQTHQKVLEDDDTFWDWFSEAQIALSVPSTSRHQRGWQGGWVGWMSYEMKEESLQGYHRKERKAATSSDVVDACWAWTDWLLERSSSGEWTLRGLIADETSSPRVAHPGGLLAWLHSLDLGVGLTIEDHANILSSVQASLAGQPQETTRPASAFPSFHPIANGSDYQSRIGLSRESIRQGDSYELTLTTAFKSQVSSETDPYELYVRLRTFNPAYYSTYISFPSVKTPRGSGVHVLSSSPERFLKIERTADGRRVEMMPIKGTKARVKPGQCVCVPGKGCEGKKPGSEECLIEGRRVDIERGQQLQADLKERAENLMIVDLIRSDLLSCCLPSTVTVPKLIALESYGVHNLVTTVQGLLADNVGSVDAVRRCFPPGSMTGAPKLRSVQLLEGFEGQRRRGIYSGALGYISVDGSTDLSVVIRTIIVEGQEMTLGAGGAITWLSDPQGEWDEVLTKVQSVVGPLEGVQ